MIRCACDAHPLGGVSAVLDSDNTWHSPENCHVVAPTVPTMHHIPERCVECNRHTEGLTCRYCFEEGIEEARREESELKYGTKNWP